MTDLSKILKNKNLKVTPQRIAILEELQKKGHSSIDDIFYRIKDKIPSISLATIYKNVLALHNADIIKSIKTPNQKQKYEINIKPHIHLFCKICRILEDFEMDTKDFTDECEIKSGYRDIDDVSVLLTGICTKCKVNQASTTL